MGAAPFSSPQTLGDLGKHCGQPGENLGFPFWNREAPIGASSSSRARNTTASVLCRPKGGLRTNIRSRRAGDAAVSAMVRRNSSPLSVTALLLGGGAVGALLTLALVQGPQPASSPATDALEEQISRLDASSETLSENIDRLEARLDQALARLDQRLTERVELPPPVGQDAEPAPKEDGSQGEKAGGKEEGKFEWIKVINSGIARVLVERGLTPYDPQVAPLVRKAGDSLRKIETSYLESTSRLQKLYQEQGMDAADLQERLSPIFDERNRRRKIILEKLASALDALLKE